MKYPQNAKSKTYQRGFTLVELMISLVISLFLLAALVQIMASSTKTYRTHEGVSRIQEASRFAVEIIGRQIRQAGYHAENQIQVLTDDPTTWPLNQSPNFAIDGTDNTGPNGSDTLNVRYFIPSTCTTMDCVVTPVLLTGAIPSGDWLRVSFFLDAERNLRCAVFNSAGTNISDTVVTVPATGQVVQGGISDMQIVYGININGDMRYESAGTITADEWPNVVNARINFTIESVEVVDPNDPALAASGGRLQRVFTSTFTLRNRLSGA